MRNTIEYVSKFDEGDLVKISSSCPSMYFRKTFKDNYIVTQISFSKIRGEEGYSYTISSLTNEEFSGFTDDCLSKVRVRKNV